MSKQMQETPVYRCLVVLPVFDTSMDRTSDPRPYSFHRQSSVVTFFGSPSFDTGRAAHEVSHYGWIVVVRASRRWSCRVLRSK